MATTEELSKFIELAKQHEIPKAEILAFARELAQEQRKERSELREAERAETEKRRVADLEREDKLRESERVEAEKRRVADLEREDKLKQQEAKRQHEFKLAEEKSQQELRLAEMNLLETRKLEDQKLDIERQKIAAQLESQRMAVESRSRTDHSDEVAGGGNSAERGTRRWDLGIGKWRTDTCLQSFLTRFEVTAKSYQLPNQLWAIELSKALEGNALDVYEAMSEESRLDYEALKRCLLKRFNYSEGGFRKKFKSAKTNVGENQTDFAARLNKYLLSWLDQAGHQRNFESLSELMVKDSFFNSQPRDVQTYLKEGGKMELRQMTTRCENYRSAHDIFGTRDDWNDKKQSNSRVERFDRNEQHSKRDDAGKYGERKNHPVQNNSTRPKQVIDDSRNSRSCYECGSFSHFARACPKRGLNSWNMNKTNSKPYQHKMAACQLVKECETSSDKDENWTERSIKLPGCGTLPVVAAVNKNHDLEQKQYVRSDESYTGFGTVNRRRVKYLRDTGSSISIVRRCLVQPEELTGREVVCVLVDKCVRTYPEAVVRVDTPYYRGQLTVACIDTALYDLIIGNDIYRRSPRCEDNTGDSDCEIVNEAVDNWKEENICTGAVIFENSKCTEAGNVMKYDSQEKQYTVESDKVNAKESIEPTQFESTCRGGGERAKSLVVARHATEKSSCKTPISVGKGIDGSLDEEDAAAESLAAMQTRNQTRITAENRAVKPLKLNKIEALNIDAGSFKQLQVSDPALAKYWILARDEDDKRKGTTDFCNEKGILYRVYRNGPYGDPIKQLVVPEPLVDKVMEYAHESLLSGHMGMASTTKKLLQEFYFPGVTSRIKRFVRSCDTCQRASNKNVGGKAPILNMKIAASAFDTIYIDVVGEIHPPSNEGHRWLLTILDSATRFPIAVCMKKIDSVSIAEALMAEFAVYGQPRVIVCDNAANLTSELMKQMYHLYGIKMYNSPVYHPAANSVVERSHATMKSILKKLIGEQPRMWHRFIAPLLFAMRSTPNSTGFSPFELMYGRTCRTHLSILKDLWTGEDDEPEVKTVYQYVLDLRQRIEETCKLAQAELVKIQDKNKRYFNSKAKLRVLKPGEKVLLLLPNSSNKLLFQWKGPVEVIERKGIVNYRVKLESGQERTFHINMLKRYVERNSETKQLESQNVKEVKQQVSSETNENEIEHIAAIMGVTIDSDSEDDEQVEERNYKGKMDLYNLKQKETWEDVDVNPDLSEIDKKKVWSLVMEYRDIFSDVPTTTPLISHKIELTSTEPVKSKPYKIPLHMIEAVEKEIKDLEEHGWIEKASSAYASPIVVVKKKGTSDIRLCVNYKRLNDITVGDSMPMAEIDTILNKIGQDTLFSTIDMTKGYYAVPMDEESKDYTTFCVPDQTYRFCVMPFGLKNSGCTYVRLIRGILEGVKNVENFVDDVIVHNDQTSSHLKTLREVFERIRMANLKVKPSKTRLGYHQVEFLGHVISEKTVMPTQTNVEKILNAPIPRTKKGVRSLCGAINFVRKFVPDCAGILSSICDLTSKRSSENVEWKPKHQEAFDKIKKLLTSKPVLRLYDISKPHVIQTDACDKSIGGVLMQEEEGELYPVIYASRKLLPREIRYSIPEKEALAIVWAISKFYSYVFGAHFTVMTDCQALTILNGKISNNARIVRWQLYLQTFDFTVKIIRGHENGLADYLSRMDTT